MKITHALLHLTISVSLMGCASFGRTLKSLVGGDPGPDPSQGQTLQTNEDGVPLSYSQNNNMPVRSDRLYKKTTREEFENENLTQSKDGSLWVMEGQESYLFSQNIIRLPGDILNVSLDGQPQKQLSTKVGVIKDLVTKAERQRQLASLSPVEAEALKTKTAEQAPQQKSDKEKEIPFDVSQVPVRIVDRSIDGSYRVKGSQIFMIGQDEYKVIVSGLVRASDVADGAVSASKVIDSKFDIVRSRKRAL